MGASAAGAGATASSLAIRQPSARRRISTKRRYVPPSAMSWSCVPRCATVPPSTTRIWSDASTVARRCAITTTVLPAVSWPMACWMSCSFSGSTLAVASSRMTMGASFRMARAMERRWRSPPDSVAPPSPRRVA